MADNIALGNGDILSADDIDGVKFQRGKLVYGGDGFATDVNVTNGLPVQPATSSVFTVQATDLDTRPISYSTDSILCHQNGTWASDIAYYKGSIVSDVNPIHVKPGTGVAWTIQDGGGAITVDGTVAISGTVPISSAQTLDFNLDQYNGSDVSASNPVYVSPGSGSSWSVSDGGGSITVDGTVAISGIAGTNIAQYNGSNVSASNPIYVSPGTGSLWDVNIGSGNKFKLTDGTNDAEMFDLTVCKALKVAIVNTSGYMVDPAPIISVGDTYSPYNSGPTSLYVRDDSLSTVSESEGQYVVQKCDSLGRAWVKEKLDTSNFFSVALSTVVSAGSSIIGGSFDATDTKSVSFKYIITNGATGPTLPCVATIEHSHDNSEWKEFRKFRSGVADSASYSNIYASSGVSGYFRFVFSGNTAQAVTATGIIYSGK